jgi:hypothetical protein
MDDADFDGDEDVDGEDFLIWQRGLGLTEQTDKSTGDANSDMTVNAGDLAIWQAQFGAAPVAAAASSIPEPATALLTAIAALAAGGVHRRRQA